MVAVIKKSSWQKNSVARSARCCPEKQQECGLVVDPAQLSVESN